MAKPGVGGFVYTGSVDGPFQTARFYPARIGDVNGSLLRCQRLDWYTGGQAM